jgi:hypothetical protein
MKPTDVINRRITRLLRSPYDVDDRGRKFYRVFLELEGTDVIELGMWRDTDPLRPFGVGGLRRSELVDLELWPGTAPVIRKHIAAVMVPSDGEAIYLLLSDGRYLWLSLEEHGMDVRVEDEAYVMEGRSGAMRDYWREK